MGLREPLDPVKGVPAFLRGPIADWIEEAILDVDRFDPGDTLRSLGLKLRVPISTDDVDDARVDFLYALQDDGWLTLDAVDLLLHWGASAVELRQVLDAADHEFTVDADGRRLISRVDPSTQSAYQEATRPEDHATAFLASAWAKTMSRDNDPSGAWADATRAVEELLKPIVSPKDSMATIGKMANALREKPSKWQCSLRADDDEASVKAFAQVLDLVGFAPDRHGGNGSVGVDPLTSRTVVLQAITICDWLRSGVLRVVDQ
jgi:hypothetical protein